DACARGIQLEDSAAKGFKGLDNPKASSATAGTRARKKSAREKISSAAMPPAESKSEPAVSNPFITHDFLLSLEESGAATARTGWLGRHLLVEDETGNVLAAMPA